jgi:hypothetical protein
MNAATGTCRPSRPEPEGHAALEHVAPHRKLGILPAQPDQLSPLVLAQPAIAALTSPAVPGHPALQRVRLDPQVPGHLRDRLARLPDQPDRALPEILIELPARPSRRPASLKAMCPRYEGKPNYFAARRSYGSPRPSPRGEPDRTGSAGSAEKSDPPFAPPPRAIRGRSPSPTCGAAGPARRGPSPTVARAGTGRCGTGRPPCPSPCGTVTRPGPRRTTSGSRWPQRGRWPQREENRRRSPGDRFMGLLHLPRVRHGPPRGGRPMPAMPPGRVRR